MLSRCFAIVAGVNAEFQKLQVRGASILFASGDQGVMGRTGQGMHGEFHPDFPAASPFVTAVGGTDFVTKSTIGPEKAWTDGGGGFSNTFPIPSWQAAAVAAFKKNSGAKLPPANLWNNTGRGYPDVSALAGEVNPYCIAAGSMLMGIAGTSAACPVVSAIFARLNALRLAKGGKPLGFLNPPVHKISAAELFFGSTALMYISQQKKPWGAHACGGVLSAMLPAGGSTRTATRSTTSRAARTRAAASRATASRRLRAGTPRRAGAPPTSR